MWIRTCQECGHKQEDDMPKAQVSIAWENRRCEECRSPALDYGKEKLSQDDSTWS